MVFIIVRTIQKVSANIKKSATAESRNPGLLLEAMADLGIDPKKSIMIGDKLDDVIAGKQANVGTTVLVQTGKRGNGRNSCSS